MSILITGAAGLIGYALTQALLAKGHRIVALDNLSTGSSYHWQRLQQEKQVTCLQQDVCQPVDWRLLSPQATPLQAIYHLAAPASPVAYQQDPIATIDICVQGTKQMLRLAQQQAVPILLASTSEVYGDPEQHPQTERYWGNVNPFGPRACYDEGKRCAEALAWAFQQTYGVKIRIARIFNTYGPGMQPNDGRVISNFVIQALRQQPLTVYGTGKQTRSFCYVDDLVHGLQLLMASDVQTPVNLGQEQECTMLALAKLVQSLFEPAPRLVFAPLPKDDPHQRRPDLSQARALLGYAPKIPLQTGLAQTVAWFRQRLAAAQLPQSA